MYRTIQLILAAALVLGVLAGCTSSNNEAQTNTNSGGETGTQPAAAKDSEASPSEEAAWPKTFVDGAGKEVKLEKAAERVVVLHPMYLEYFFALESPPVASGGATSAMAEFETLQPFVGTAEIIDLGGGSGVNVESVVQANPDVIVTFAGSVDNLYDDLVKIAPVVQINYTDTWENATRLCGLIVGKEELAEKLITETWELIAETKDKLQAIADKDFALLRVSSKGGFVAQGTINTNYYNPDTGFGLKIPNGYPENNDAISLEGLVEMDPDYIIIQHTPSLAEAAIKENESLEVWKSLKAVKNDQVLIFDGSLNSMSVLSVRLAAEKFQALVES